MSRELFAREALAQIAKLLTLLDRNPHSPTFGCFDRNFWHYKIVDFPSGMAQEFVWPLALAFDTDCENNPYFNQPSIRTWAEAAIRFGATSSHGDGSCDDYFPFERAAGAAAFSLLASIESYKLIGMNDDLMLRFFERRADWLASHQESGQLSNHQALIALCFELLGSLLGTSRWERPKQERINRVLSWQSEEGWFKEYEGCDPGYHTLTISCLARLHELQPTAELKGSIEWAIRLAAVFVHPDGSYGGEYGSRNTYNFFPHGFELAGRWMPEALTINDQFLDGIAGGLAPCYADDHIIGHHAWNYFLAYRDFVDARPAPGPRAQGRTWLKQAGILIDRRAETELYVALNKGGVFKLFRDHKLVASDTQLSLAVRVGKSSRNAVGHLVDRYHVEVGADQITIRGSLGWAKQKQMTPLALVGLRLAMLSGGRFFPDLVRKLLQKLLIVGKEPAPFLFTRSFKWEGGGALTVVDDVYADSWNGVEKAGIGCDQTSIYVVMSRTFQMGQLQEWLDLTDMVKRLVDGQPLRIERQL